MKIPVGSWQELMIILAFTAAFGSLCYFLGYRGATVKEYYYSFGIECIKED